MRVALGVEYDGAGFFGWQVQPDRPTVQATLGQALSAIAGGPVDVVCAGRTDTGVHALMQVVHFDTAAVRPLSAWVKGVNAHLPASVVVLWARWVAQDFHARFSALARSYEYVLLNRAVRPAAGARQMGWFHLPLDLARMQAAARSLVGRHDFSAFRSAECQARSPIRDLSSLEISRHGDIIRFSLEANAFLHHMVRNIVGSLVYVGKGRQPPEWVAEVLRSGDRSRAAPTFSPHGLYLAGVHYGPEWGLPAPERASPAALLKP